MAQVILSGLLSSTLLNLFIVLAVFLMSIKMRKTMYRYMITSLCLYLLVAVQAKAQQTVANVLQQVAANNKTLQAAARAAKPGSWSIKLV
ncbi:hypothetical protein GCM10028895_55810 [Pontibacter rugosus]